jgi:hypothetical protein
LPSGCGENSKTRSCELDQFGELLPQYQQDGDGSNARAYKVGKLQTLEKLQIKGKEGEEQGDVPPSQHTW